MVKYILLDTSFIIEALSCRIDLVAECRHILPGCRLALIDQTYYELKQLATRNKTKTAQLAQLAQDVLKKKQFLTIETTEDQHVDELIVDVVQTRSDIAAVATTDRALRTILSTLRTPVVIIRQRQRFELV